MLENVFFNSIFVKNIPSQLKNNELDQLFQIFNPVSVKYLRNSRQSTAFIDFRSNNEALHAIVHLHQRCVLGKLLTAAFNKRKDSITCDENAANQSDISVPYENIRNVLKKDINLLGNRDSIPIQPQLRYKYPEPTEEILTNIVRTLVTNKPLYYQTLHLMNKLHLPCPFSKGVQFAGDHVVVDGTGLSSLPHLDGNQPTEMEVSSGNESEIEESAAPRRKRPRLELPPIGPVKLRGEQQWQKTHSVKMVGVGAAFEPVALRQRSRINVGPLSASGTSLDVTADKREDEYEGGFGVFAAPASTSSVAVAPVDMVDVTTSSEYCEMLQNQLSLDIEHRGNPQKDPSEKILNEEHQKEEESKKLEEEEIAEVPVGLETLDSLRLRQLPESELARMPLFKQYQRGTACRKLYVKNISRKASTENLRAVFGCFVDWTNILEISGFCVKHFVEGRMKGQAFVTFPETNTAQRALEATHGLVLLDKPISVQFSRSSD